MPVEPAKSDEIINRAGSRAHANNKYSGCSQSVMGALQDELGIGNKESFKAATMLSGGFRRGETCGAIIGGIMALGLIIGRESMEDTETYRRAMSTADEVSDRFKQELQQQYGFSWELKSTLCPEIQERIYGRPFDLRHEFEDFLKAGGHSDTGCPRVCAIAAQVVAEKVIELNGTKA